MVASKVRRQRPTCKPWTMRRPSWDCSRARLRRATGAAQSTRICAATSFLTSPAWLAAFVGRHAASATKRPGDPTRVTKAPAPTFFCEVPRRRCSATDFATGRRRAACALWALPDVDGTGSGHSDERRCAFLLKSKPRKTPGLSPVVAMCGFIDKLVNLPQLTVYRRASRAIFRVPPQCSLSHKASRTIFPPLTPTGRFIPSPSKCGRSARVPR